MKRILTALTCLVVLAGCQTTPRVENEYLDNANFNDIQTYAFTPQLSGKNMPAQIGPKAINTMRSKIKERFAQLGYSTADVEDADIVVDLKADILRVNDNPNWTLGFGYHRNRAFYGIYDPISDDKDERTLIIDIYDNRGKTPELIWRGYTTKKFFIHSKAAPEEIGLHISEIMRNFPPIPAE